MSQSLNLPSRNDRWQRVWTLEMADDNVWSLELADDNVWSLELADGNVWTKSGPRLNRSQQQQAQSFNGVSVWVFRFRMYYRTLSLVWIIVYGIDPS